MSLIYTRYCGMCGKETDYTDGACDVCAAEAVKRHKDEYFRGLDALTMEQRVRRIEEILYTQRYPCVSLLG